MKISFSDSRIGYMGRIGMKEDGAHFYYAASSAEVLFTGSEISVEICNSTCYGTIALGYIIDGRMGMIPMPRSNDGKDIVYLCASELETQKIHKLIIYKRQAAQNSFVLKSITCNGEFIELPPRPEMKLEFYGDSVTAGEVTEAIDFAGRCDPAGHDGIYDNSWYSYAWITARSLNAQLHNVAQGGIAVFDDTGYFHAPKMIGMESVYDKDCYFPEAGEISTWDFSKYIPDIVVFALGQNDKHNGVTDADDIDIRDPEYREKWKNGYKQIARSVHSHYTDKTKYIFLTTLLMHDPEWDKAIDEIVEELRGDGLDAYHVLFTRNGAATPGHPRIPEHMEMADELTQCIVSILNRS